MSISDVLRLIAVETALAELAVRVEALEEALAATSASPCVPPTQRPPNAPAIVLGKHGGDHGNQYTGGKRQTPNGKLPLGSNSRAYILARLDRDRPDLAQQVRDKEKSASAAAREAGFGKRMAPADPTGAGLSERAP